MIKHMMFDFDGTIADTSEGIINSMHYTYDKLAEERVADETIYQMIGPPLEEMFARLLHKESSPHVRSAESTADDNYIKQAVLYFRECYAAKGVRELCLYPEVKETLERLREQGSHLYIVTSKPELFVREICKEQGILNCFTAITGVSTVGRSLSKAERMKQLIKEYGITPESGIMVGDRPEDASAAAANGIACVGVTYGFGKREELAAGCVRLIDRFCDL